MSQTRSLFRQPLFRISLLGPALLLIFSIGLPGFHAEVSAQGISRYSGEIYQAPGQNSASYSIGAPQGYPPAGPQGYSIGAPEQDYYSMNAPSAPQPVAGDMGWLARLNYQAGKTIGTEESLLNISAMPYVFNDNTMFLGDLNMYRLNSGRGGGYAGIGVRQYLPTLDRTLGLITAYGIDGTYKESFDNVAVSIESRGQNFDWLTNIYFPIGDDTRDLGLEFADGSQEFSGNNILFDQVRTTGYNLAGFDMMFGTPLPWEFTRRFDMRAYAGFYNFNHSELDDIWGYAFKFEANVLKSVDLNLNVTRDNTFDTRVTFNASWTFDPSRDYGSSRTTRDRMLLPTSRLYTIPKAEVVTIEEDFVAINPLTGNPYFVVHVDSVTGVNAPGAGTFENPFNSIDNAQNGGNAVPIDTYDIMFVRSGSQFDGEPTIVVPEGKRFLGEGDRVTHLLEYQPGIVRAMPRARGTYTDGIFDARPLYTNLGVPGGPGATFDTLTSLGGTVLSNAETEFSGFVLGNPIGTDPTSGDTFANINPAAPGTPGNGPIGDGIVYQNLATPIATRFVDIHGAGGNGLNFTNQTETYILEAMVVNQSQNTEMFVSGGAPTITMTSGIRGDNQLRTDSLIINRANAGAVIAPNGVGGAGDNHDLLVINTTGGSVLWQDVTTNDIGGDGILISNAASNVSVPVSTTITNSRQQAVFVAPGSSGTINLSANRNVNPAAPTTFSITNPGNNAIQLGLPTEPFDPLQLTQAQVNFAQPIVINNLSQDFSGLMIADMVNDTIFFGDAELDINYGFSAGTASAIDIFQNSTGDITFNNSIFINSPGGSGLRISNNTVNPAGPNDARVRFVGGDSRQLNIFNANENEFLPPGQEGAAIVIGNDSLAGPPSNSVTGSAYEGDVLFNRQVNLLFPNAYGLWAVNNTGTITSQNRLFIDYGGLDDATGIYLEGNTGDIIFNRVTIEDLDNDDINFIDPNEPILIGGDYRSGELAGLHAAIDLRNNSGTIVFADLDITDSMEGTAFFAIDNSEISIFGGDIDTAFGTALDIFTRDSLTLATGRLTDVRVNLDFIEATQSPDHGVHLANVKGRVDLNSGNLNQNGIFTGPNTTDAALYVDNSSVRVFEESNGFDYFSFQGLSVELNDLTMNQNAKGIVALDFDFLDVQFSDFNQNRGEAIFAQNIARGVVQGSSFTGNQTFNVGDGATIRMEYTRTLNNEDQATGPTFYDFLVGTRIPDFLDDVPLEQNTFTETVANYSILMVNNTDDNTIGELNVGTTGSETGFIVNNNDFFNDGNVIGQFQSFVYFFDNGNSRTNMNVARNFLQTADPAGFGGNGNPVLGAIGFNHNSDANNNTDDIVFTAIDNVMDLPINGSVGYGFITRGNGFARILVDDTFDPVVTTIDGFQLEIPPFPEIGNSTQFGPGFLTVADMIVSGTAFQFDLETDAQIDILNTEIFMEEDNNGILNFDTEVQQTHRAFLFQNVQGDNTNINIAGNTIVFEDPNATGAFIIPNIDPLTLFINEVDNDILVTEFELVFGQANLTSTANNNVLYFDGANSAFLTNPFFLFSAPNLNNISGQFQFNNVFVP